MDHPPSDPVNVPADIDLDDKIAWGLTARQLLILGGGLLLLYTAYQVSRDVPLLVFALLAAPVAAAVIALAVARRDGISLDRYLLAVFRHLVITRRLRPSEGAGRGAEAGGLGRGGWWARLRRPALPVRLPAREVAQARFGVVDLGAHGLAALAVVSTVPWSTRSSLEQDALVKAFARWLHSLSNPVQILVRALPLDLSGHVAQLARDATDLGHPALTQAAVDHASYLDWIAAEHALFRRQVVLVFREPNLPTPATSPAAQARRDRAALNRLERQLADATTLLGAAGLAVTVLDADQAASVLASACRPLLSEQLDSTNARTGDFRDEANPAQAGDRAAVVTHPPDGYTADPDHGWYPLLPEGWMR